MRKPKFRPRSPLYNSVCLARNPRWAIVRTYEGRWWAAEPCALKGVKLDPDLFFDTQAAALKCALALAEEQMHAILDTARFGDRITVTRSNGGDLTATVSGPVLAAPGVSRAVGIDLLDGGPHIIRRDDGEVCGRIIDLRVEAPRDDLE